jgi:hypothetical protein
MIHHDLFAKVKSLFYGDVDKTWAWFATRNPCLNSEKPLDVIKAGKIAKVEKYVNEVILNRQVLL